MPKEVQYQLKEMMAEYGISERFPASLTRSWLIATANLCESLAKPPPQLSHKYCRNCGKPQLRQLLDRSDAIDQESWPFFMKSVEAKVRREYEFLLVTWSSTTSPDAEGWCTVAFLDLGGNCLATIKGRLDHDVAWFKGALGQQLGVFPQQLRLVTVDGRILPDVERFCLRCLLQEFEVPSFISANAGADCNLQLCKASSFGRTDAVNRATKYHQRQYNSRRAFAVEHRHGARCRRAQKLMHATKARPRGR